MNSPRPSSQTYAMTGSAAVSSSRPVTRPPHAAPPHQLAARPDQGKPAVCKPARPAAQATARTGRTWRRGSRSRGPFQVQRDPVRRAKLRGDVEHHRDRADEDRALTEHLRACLGRGALSVAVCLTTMGKRSGRTASEQQRGRHDRQQPRPAASFRSSSRSKAREEWADERADAEKHMHDVHQRAALAVAHQGRDHVHRGFDEARRDVQQEEGCTATMERWATAP